MNNNVEKTDINQTNQQTKSVTVKKMLAFKIIVGALYLLATVFAVSFVPDIVKGLQGDGADRFGAGIGLVVMLVLGLIAYVPSFLASLIGIIISAIWYKKRVVTKSTLIFFIILLALTVLSCVGIYLFVALIN